MEALEVRLVHLPAMRFACASGFGKEPEAAAWKRLLGWAQACGMSPKNRRFFGFNNPDPAPGSPNYGYDQWMTLQDDETILPDAPVTSINFTGGYYAVVRCRLSEIGEAWQALVRWLESSPHRMVAEQCLEEALTPEVFTGEGEALFAPEKSPEDALFDLYLPIKA
jgi:DNA gyrase inhibitor GyrI